MTRVVAPGIQPVYSEVRGEVQHDVEKMRMVVVITRSKSIAVGLTAYPVLS